MAWESRGKARFYYRSERVGDRVVKRYFGRGAAALLAQGLDEQARRRRAAEAAALRAEQARLAPREGALRALDDGCNLMVAATLTAAGFHRPDYGAWRSRRARATC